MYFVNKVIIISTDGRCCYYTDLQREVMSRGG